jgi:hypothetical protein
VYNCGGLGAARPDLHPARDRRDRAQENPSVIAVGIDAYHVGARRFECPDIGDELGAVADRRRHRDADLHHEVKSNARF